MSNRAKIIDVITEIPQFGQFEYVRDYSCPECEKDCFDSEKEFFFACF